MLTLETCLTWYVTVMLTKISIIKKKLILLIIYPIPTIKVVNMRVINRWKRASALLNYYHDDRDIQVRKLVIQNRIEFEIEQYQ